MKGKRSSPIPLYLQIEEDLRSRIRSGETQALEQVPSESELAASFGVSRMTARKALDRLVAEGILFRRAGKGTYVAPSKIEHGASTRLSFSGAMSSLGLRVETQVLGVDTLPAPTNVASALGLTEGGEVHCVRRLRMVDGEAAAIHVAYLPLGLAAVLDQDLTGSLNDAMARIGANVAHARDTIEGVTPTPEEAMLLEIPPTTAVLRVEGVGLSADLVPLRYTDAVYRGDRFRFQVASDAEQPELQVEVKAAPASPSA